MERGSEATTCTNSTTTSSVSMEPSGTIELTRMKGTKASIDGNNNGKMSSIVVIVPRKLSPRTTVHKQHVFSPVHAGDQVRVNVYEMYVFFYSFISMCAQGDIFFTCSPSSIFINSVFSVFSQPQHAADEDLQYKNGAYESETVLNIVTRKSPRKNHNNIVYSNSSKSSRRTPPDSPLSSPGSSDGGRSSSSGGNYDGNYVFFMPGGDAVVYFMGAIFVAIILDKIVMG